VRQWVSKDPRGKRGIRLSLNRQEASRGPTSEEERGLFIIWEVPVTWGIEVTGGVLGYHVGKARGGAQKIFPHKKIGVECLHGLRVKIQKRGGGFTKKQDAGTEEEKVKQDACSAKTGKGGSGTFPEGGEVTQLFVDRGGGFVKGEVSLRFG